MIAREVDPKDLALSSANRRLLHAYGEQLCGAYFVRRLEGFIHNLNGPLQILWLRSEQLEKEISGFQPDPGAAEEHTSWARKLGGRLDSFLKAFRQLDDSLKFITKDGIGRCGNDAESLSVNDVLGDVLFLMKADMFLKHQVEVNFEPADPAARIQGRRNQLCALFLCLIQNSLEAMVDSPVRRLSIQVSGDHRKVVTRVHDTGCGIDERYSDRLFELFFTTKSDQRYNGEWVTHKGLGLPLVSALISDYEGKIAFESQAGNTVFSVEFPV
jgi:signal transduction histidine kinase